MVLSPPQPHPSTPFKIEINALIWKKLKHLFFQQEKNMSSLFANREIKKKQKNYSFYWIKIKWGLFFDCFFEKPLFNSTKKINYMRRIALYSEAPEFKYRLLENEWKA